MLLALFKVVAVDDTVGLDALLRSLDSLAACHRLLVDAAIWACDHATARVISDALRGESVLSDEELDDYAIASWVAQLDEALEVSAEGEQA